MSMLFNYLLYLLIHKIRAAFHLTGYEGIGELFSEIYWGEKAMGGIRQPVILKQIQ